MLDGLESDSPEVRQAAAFGIGNMAIFARVEFANAIEGERKWL